MTNKLLLVEDDAKLAKFMMAYLKNHQYSVEWASNHQQTIEKLQHHPIDLIILDVMLPGKSGFDICRDIRQDNNTPIIMLTARSNDLDQIKGLDSGADDYIYKPVEPLVLLARIKSHLKRHSSLTAPVKPSLSEYNFGDLHVNTKGRSVLMAQQPVHLTDGEFSLLQELVENAGTILDRDNLFEKIVGRPYNGTDRTIDGRISRLRKKLGDDQDNPVYIKSIRGKGYLFTGDDWISE